MQLIPRVIRRVSFRAEWYANTYPGQGVGQTWLGADGATITLEQGILTASEGWVTT